MHKGLQLVPAQGQRYKGWLHGGGDLEQRLRLPRISLWAHIQLQKERLTVKAAEWQGTRCPQAQGSRNRVKSLVGPHPHIQSGDICSS